MVDSLLAGFTPLNVDAAFAMASGASSPSATRKRTLKVALSPFLMEVRKNPPNRP